MGPRIRREATLGWPRRWLLPLICCPLLALVLIVQASRVQERIAAEAHHAAAIGAGMPGRGDASWLRTQALQRIGITPERLTYPANGPGEAVAWSSDGLSLAVGAGDGTIALWNGHGSRRRWAINPFHRPVRALAWSPDGRILAAGIQAGAVLLLDGRTHRILARLPVARYIAPAVAYAADGRMAVASGLGDLRVYGTNAGRPPLRAIARLDLGRATTALGWSPDGLLLAVGTVDGSLTVWEPRAGRIRVRLAGGSALWSLQWASRGMQLALGYADGTVRILSGPRLPLVRHWSVGRPINTLAWSADGTLLAVTAIGHPLRIYEVGSGTLVGQIRTGWDTNQVAFSPDGLSLAAMTDGRDLRIWHLAPPRDGLGRLICAVQRAACTGLSGPGSSTSYMGRWAAPTGPASAACGGAPGGERLKVNAGIRRDVTRIDRCAAARYAPGE